MKYAAEAKFDPVRIMQNPNQPTVALIEADSAEAIAEQFAGAPGLKSLTVWEASRPVDFKPSMEVVQ